LLAEGTNNPDSTVSQALVLVHFFDGLAAVLAVHVMSRYLVVADSVLFVASVSSCDHEIRYRENSAESNVGQVDVDPNVLNTHLKEPGIQLVDVLVDYFEVTADRDRVVVEVDRRTS
jgi:hypothetical protein